MTKPHALAPAPALALAVLLGFTPSGASAQTPTRMAVASHDLSGAVEQTTRLVTPAVVEIFSTSYTPAEGVVPRTADLVSTERASGSGIIVDPDGYIITNAHVVRGAQRLRVEFSIPATGRSLLATRTRTVSGRLVGMDLETDLAVIKIDEQNLPVLTFGDSDELKAGQLVLAFGSPLGLHNSVSLGVVSAIARQLEPESPMVYVQTDASINRGSSGGPLVDLRGRIVGVNTLILSQAGGNDGLGFAAPSNIVRTVYEQIRKHGRVRRGDIGVRAQTVNPVLASGLGLKRDHGAIVADVIPGSPAERAGLRPGDVVVSLDGKPIENGRQLRVNLYQRFAGNTVTLEVVRDTQALTVPVVIAERPELFAGLMAVDPRQNTVTRLGILAVNLNPQIARMLPVQRVSSGIVVVSTVAGAIDVREGGLMAGDVLHAINRTPIQDLSQFRTLVDRMSPGDPVVLQLERRGELMYLAFSVE